MFIASCDVGSSLGGEGVHGSLALVFVVAAQPAHGLIAFVAALRSPVEYRVVAHQELRTPGVAGVAVVDGVALKSERAQSVPLGEIAVDVRPGRAGVLACNQRQFLTDGRLLVQQRQKRQLVGLSTGTAASCVIASPAETP